MLSLGATRMEAAKPLIQRSLATALQPSLNQMSTVGLVSIPGEPQHDLNPELQSWCLQSMGPVAHVVCWLLHELDPTSPWTQ